MDYKRVGFEAYGVKICFETNDQGVFREIKRSLPGLFPGNFKDAGFCLCESVYRVRKNPRNLFELIVDGKLDSVSPETLTLNRFLLTLIRLRVAERAVGRVFLHAGAVAWKGKGIIIPAGSFRGKTTLVGALVKKGALYFSDEFAVLDKNGRLHPFPKDLSIRSGGNQRETPVRDLGGRAGKRAVPVGFVLLTEYKKGGSGNLRQITPGAGLLEVLSHTIPIRYNPEFTLEVLNKTLNRAIIAKSFRGEAEVFSERLLNFFEKHLI